MSAASRIAFFLPSLAGGGAERVMLNLALGLSERGYPVDIVLAEASGPLLRFVTPPIRVIDLKTRRVICSVGPLAGYLRRERPTALIGALDHANLVAMTAARLARTQTRTVITIHCTFPTDSADIRVHSIPWLLGRFHKWADVIVAVSKGVADDLVRKTGIPRDRVDVIYNPVITPTLLAAASQSLADGSCFDDSPVVLGVGRLSSQKNFQLLLDAFALVRLKRNARLVILGEGPERAALEARIQELHLQDDVSLPGFVDNPYAWMSRAGVLVLSSDFEGLPTVLVEALAVGTPVVSTDCPSGPREILLDGELGDLVPLGDVQAMASAIDRALINPRQLPPANALRGFTLDAAVEQFQEACGLHA